MDNALLETVDRSNFDPNAVDSNGRRKGDPWGNAMSLWFDIAEYLTVKGVHVPGHWQFRPSPMLPETVKELRTSRFYRDIDVLEEMSTKELIHTGSVLERYTQMLDSAGYSY